MKYIIRVYRELFRYAPCMKWQMPLRAVFVAALPFIESAIPAMAIALIMEKTIGRYMAGITLLYPGNRNTTGKILAGITEKESDDGLLQRRAGRKAE